jgi:hypothetical protein
MSSLINKNHKCKIVDIEGIKVVVIDEFLTDPDNLREYAIYLKNKVNSVQVGVGYELYPPEGELEKRYPNFMLSLTRLVHSKLGEIILHYAKPMERTFI